MSLCQSIQVIEQLVCCSSVQMPCVIYLIQILQDSVYKQSAPLSNVIYLSSAYSQEKLSRRAEKRCRVRHLEYVWLDNRVPQLTLAWAWSP